MEKRDKEMELLDVKKGKDGKGGENYYRIKWGKVDATNVHFTWEPESNLPLAKALLAGFDLILQLIVRSLRGAHGICPS